MDTVEFQCGNWQLQCLPDDGARISKLRFSGLDLLADRPDNFRPPSVDYGKYEIRPVYGYDDCFPTVDACKSPIDDSDIADHGHLCWLPWQVEASGNSLHCEVVEETLNIQFSRTLVFDRNNLRWEFEVLNNNSDIEISFLHVMHGLMPLGQIDSIALPGFNELFDEINNKTSRGKDPAKVAEQLLKSLKGKSLMLLLRGVEDGSFELGFKSGFKLLIEYPAELFSTLGIWWNNEGYPDEDGCRRIECAFEPMSSHVSSLYESYKQGKTLVVMPEQKFNWQINWEIW